MLSEVPDYALRSVAQLAPTLKEAELRVLLALTALAEPPLWGVRISTRALRESTGCGRPNIQRAIDNLALRNVISIRQGTAVSASVYLLQFLRTLPMGGSITEPPP